MRLVLALLLMFASGMLTGWIVFADGSFALVFPATVLAALAGGLIRSDVGGAIR